MKFKTLFDVSDKKKEINYIKEVYKRRIQYEIDSYVDPEEKPDTIVAQDVLYLDRIFIQQKLFWDQIITLEIIYRFSFHYTKPF